MENSNKRMAWAYDRTTHVRGAGTLLGALSTLHACIIGSSYVVLQFCCHIFSFSF